MTKVVSLTDKQVEAMELVCQHHQTKEIARILGISPRSVDQRIDGARKKFCVATRVEAARIYAAQSGMPYRLTGEPFTVSSSLVHGPQMEPPRDELRFEDAQVYYEGAPWQQPLPWRFPDFKPGDMGAVSRLIAMVILAVFILLLVTLGLDLARSMGMMFRA